MTVPPVAAVALINETHDPLLRSWVTAANNPQSDFPIQNLPFGVFRVSGSKSHDFSGGVGIGDQILDLTAACKAGLFSGAAASAAQAAALGQLNQFMALGQPAWHALRTSLSQLLREGSSKRDMTKACLVPMAKAEMGLPAKVANYTDFYASVYHATNVGKLFRPDAPLLPNYKHIPIGYHGRASSVRVSGQPVIRPKGQLMPAGATAPFLAASKRLDYELEMALWIGPGNVLGQPIDIQDANDHWFGIGLLNDWSARDIQGWEYQPLGPFLAKNFLTSVSPWIVTLEALAPFRCAFAARPEGDPQPLPYLTSDLDQTKGAFDITVQASIQTSAMRARSMPAHQLSSTSLKHLYWTGAQLITHHTVGGCNLESGDLLGTGTTSGPTASEQGCLLELTQGGKVSIALPDGTTRLFLEDGDQLNLTAFCERAGFARIGFGQCSGTVAG
jgi:fumarylacetoacetase